jgi:hypothetical protein
MTSAFEKLCGAGKPLRAEPPDAKEFAGLVRSGKARLKDASSRGLALESRFDLTDRYRLDRRLPRGCSQGGYVATNWRHVNAATSAFRWWRQKQWEGTSGFLGITKAAFIQGELSQLGQASPNHGPLAEMQ